MSGSRQQKARQAGHIFPSKYNPTLSATAFRPLKFGQEIREPCETPHEGLSHACIDGVGQDYLT